MWTKVNFSATLVTFRAFNRGENVDAETTRSAEYLWQSTPSPVAVRHVTPQATATFCASPLSGRFIQREWFILRLVNPVAHEKDQTIAM
jgi:hypothetical protein